ncbi:MAG: tetratricopeptide repeat protein [Ginsengibacter sp.]
MNNRNIKFVSVFLFFCFLLPDVHAQLDKITFDLQKDKPQKFKSLTLKSEKTGEKKFTLPRRFVQNTVSHYNYYFNANNKINAVIERARMANRDDYSKLIPYYSFSLDNTALQKSELDSVIYKATAGILLHDLRSDWVDNLYLLIGEAYYLKKDFDSATMTFQFINYNLFPRKKKSEDDQLVVGTNENASNNALSISSKEDRNIVKKIFSRPPSRNDAFVWQVRALIDTGEFAEAAGLINTLKNDPLFPKRLNIYFEEVQGYWFFQQQMYDSAIVYIKSALPNAIDMADKARREYLLAQLYEMRGYQDTAAYYYDKAIKNTTDPLMDIYANLNKAKMLKTNDSAGINKSISTLSRMARKDKFESYRDIVFYSAAELALIKPDTAQAVTFFRKSAFYNEKNLSLKNKAFLALAEINYNQKNYKQAFNFYDSLQTAGDSTLGDLTEIRSRKEALLQIVKHINIIEREDSLQAIAALSPAERESLLKKLSKTLRKERGVKEEDANYGSASDFFSSKNAPTDIFANNGSSGDWYFYNSSLKSKGYNDFKRTWGKRKNVDNWRRISGSNQSANAGGPGNNPDEQSAGNSNAPLASKTGSAKQGDLSIPYQQDISVDGLLANIPLTQSALDSSNSRITYSLFELGKNYQTLLEDYNAAIDAYEKSLKRFPDSLHGGELYLNLSFCYQKTGDQQKADYYKNLLLNKFSKSKYTQYVLHPESLNPSKNDTAATSRYNEIYNLFIEGNFEKAISEKNAADSMYGTGYWNPQLLYIQSVYYIQKRQDSAAIKTLYEIMARYPTSPMKEKASTMIDVLNKRDSIEHYLTNLQVVRAKEDSQITVYDDAKIINNVKAPVINNEKPAKPNEITASVKVELNPDKKLAPPVKNAVFTFDPNEPQYVIMVLTKVDPVYASEARNAFVRYNNQHSYSSNFQITKDTLDSDRMLLLFSPFDNASEAIKYRDNLKKDAPLQISWLPAQKYAFYIISAANLQLLKENKNLQSYIDILNQKYPGKF